MTPLNAKVLVLNADFSPLETVLWKRAIERIVQGKYEALEYYAEGVVRSAYLTFDLPAVVRLTTGYAKPKVRLKRGSLLERDGFTCQYCGVKPSDLSALTMDHVVPRAQAIRGRVTLPWSGASVPVHSWENLVTACAVCNHDKADRTPREAGYRLKNPPRKPHAPTLVKERLRNQGIPEEWKIYIGS